MWLKLVETCLDLLSLEIPASSKWLNKEAGSGITQVGKSSLGWSTYVSEKSIRKLAVYIFKYTLC